MLEPVTREARDSPSRQEAEAAVRTLLLWIGDDPDREGLRDTPGRVVKAYEEIYSGYRHSVGDFLTRIFTEVQGYDELVLVRELAFASHSADNLLPFLGKAHIAYYPGIRGVIGLSKLAKLVDILARRVQTQESLTSQIAASIEKYLQPLGCAVMIEARHLCGSIMAPIKEGSTTVTSHYIGIFREPDQKARFLSLVRS